MIKPLNDWILVKPNVEERVSDGGLIMPEESRQTAVKSGVVLAVGSGRLSKKGVRIPPDVPVGSTVFYIFALEKTKTGESIKMSLGTDEFLIRESDILAIEER